MLNDGGQRPTHDENGKFAPGNPWAYEPGQSGNPSGRPKNLRSVCWKYRRLLDAHPEELEQLMLASLRDKDASTTLANVARVHDGQDGGKGLDDEADRLEAEETREQTEALRPQRALQEILTLARRGGLSEIAQLAQDRLLEPVHQGNRDTGDE